MVFSVESHPDAPDQGFAYFRMQVDAYHDLESFYPRDIPSATLRKIQRRAAAADGDDFVGRLRTVEREVFAYRLLQGEEDADIPAAIRKMIRKLARLEAGPKADFRTQCRIYRRQIAAFRQLEKLSAARIQEAGFDAALKASRYEHPGDFVAQLEAVTRTFGRGHCTSSVGTDDE